MKLTLFSINFNKRANFAGAMIGAASGVESVPEDWIGKVNGADNIIEMILSAAQKG